MPVLEVTQLHLKGGMSAAKNRAALLDMLSTVRRQLQTGSRFYSCIEDPTLLYILGLWPSLDAHLDFLASPARDQILGPQENIFDFKWSVHMELDAMSSLPLQSPILAIARLAVTTHLVDAYHAAVIKDSKTLFQGTHHCADRVVHGWRCDAPPGSHEALLFIGWPDAQAHNDFMDTMRDNGSVGARPTVFGKYEHLQAHTAYDLERKGTGE